MRRESQTHTGGTKPKGKDLEVCRQIFMEEHICTKQI
jgi:hypothetical protein